MSNARELAELGGSYGTGGFVGMKNRIINGAMMIDQRNAGASVTVTSTGANQYTLDRWAGVSSVSSKFSIQQNAGAVAPPTGFSSYLGVTSLAATTLGAGDYYLLRHVVEGYNVADLSWGGSGASPVTASFWVRSSLTGTFGGVLRNDSANRSYPFTYTINSANTWEQKSVTIIGDTTGTWAKNNTGGIYVEFGLGVGSTYSGAAGSWSSSLFISATGATSVVGTNGATLYITGVQLEKGSTATSFDYRPYGTELAMCQRYCYNISYALAGERVAVGGCGFSRNAVIFTVIVTFPVPMRATPSFTCANGTAYFHMSNFGGDFDFATLSYSNDSHSNLSYSLSNNTFSGLTAGGGMVYANNAASYALFSAEL